MKIEVEKIARSPSRSGRELQRYHLDRRQVVGYIPYRYGNGRRASASSVADQLEVLLISSQKNEVMMFPKGGWEADESLEEALLRETLEEAGVTGTIQSKLGEWIYKSKSQDKMHDGHMFALLVEQQLEEWPERNVRRRKWVSVEEAMKLCPHEWMKEALDALVKGLEMEGASETEASSSPCSSEDELDVLGDVAEGTSIGTRHSLEGGEISSEINTNVLGNVVRNDRMRSFASSRHLSLCVDRSACGFKRNLSLMLHRKRQIEVMQPC